jgi:HD-GYP domain-containing protein (c-di-GMP phosphodiesterase class II)
VERASVERASVDAGIRGAEFFRFANADLHKLPHKKPTDLTHLTHSNQKAVSIATKRAELSILWITSLEWSVFAGAKMNDETDFFIHNADEDLIQDLIDFFNESYELIEHNFSVYTSSHEKALLIDQAFRSIHTIKSHATVCEIHPVVQFTQSIEDTVYALKSGRIEFSEILCDSILLSMDRLKELIVAIIDQDPLDKINRTTIQKLLSDIAKSRKMDYVTTSRKLIETITGQFRDASAVELSSSDESPKPSVAEPSDKAPSLNVSHTESNAAPSPKTTPPTQEGTFTSQKPTPTPAKHSKPETETASLASGVLKTDERSSGILSTRGSLDDMAFFKLLAERVDTHNPDWENRSTQQLELAIDINQHAGLPIPPEDLTVAVYLHDIGMAFVPAGILLKEGKLDQNELKILQKHPVYGAEIVRRFSDWSHIEPMILQHHERPDGKGYPYGINNEALCMGARLLAILDAYFAMTNFRADRKHKRSKLRAISEINACSGTQFCSEWVKHFNSVMLKK